MGKSKLIILVPILLLPVFSVWAANLEDDGEQVMEKQRLMTPNLADGDSVTGGQQKFAIPRGEAGDSATLNQIQKFYSDMQGKSLEGIVQEKSWSADPLVEPRKQVLLDYANKHAGTSKGIDPQDIRSFLVNENMGVDPAERVFTVQANKKKMQPGSYDPVDPEFRGSQEGGGSNNVLPRRGKNEQTVGEGNGPEIYSPDTSFNNQIAKLKTSITAGDSSTMRSESDGCEGNLNTSHDKGATPQDIKKCFRKLNDDLYPALSSSKDFGYLSTLPLLTVLVDNDMKHVCMASYYRQGVWITASHCLTPERIGAGISVVSEANPIKITSSMVVSCPKSNCDVSFIKAKTPIILGTAFELQNPNMAGISWGERVFIPGIEVGTKLDQKSLQGSIRTNLMWSDVGRGYCKVLKVSDGCINHTCSTLEGFSGAPVYWVDANSKKLQLIGIHTGNTFFAGCDSTATNYAVTSEAYKGADQ